MAAPSPSPAPPATAWRFAETSRRDECTSRCRAWGCRTRRSLLRGSDAVSASAKHSQTMSKNWYAETCIPYGLRTPYIAIPKLRLRMPHVSSRSYRVAASIRPRVFLSKTIAPAIPCGRAGADWAWFLSWLNTYKAGGRACEGRQRGLTFLIESVIINICQPPICQPQTPAKTGVLGRFCS